ncbi:MAG: HPr family phosphocarrier protein [Oscillospiraceae bacterium]|jgi:phosphotransferase system HPr-like phosphotransfer protein|nr:HPr family phosphocarrier protein [Oscillospiraceae bacterium]
MTYNIKISSSEQAQKLNNIAQQFPYDIWVHGKSGYADAKSMLGLMLFTIEPDLKLVIEDGVDTKHLEKEIADFLVKG